MSDTDLDLHWNEIAQVGKLIIVKIHFGLYIFKSDMDYGVPPSIQLLVRPLF